MGRDARPRNLLDGDHPSVISLGDGHRPADHEEPPMMTTTTLTPTGSHVVGGRVRTVAGVPMRSFWKHSASARSATTVDLPRTAWPPGSAT